MIFLSTTFISNNRITSIFEASNKFRDLQHNYRYLNVLICQQKFRAVIKEKLEAACVWWNNEASGSLSCPRFSARPTKSLAREFTNYFVTLLRAMPGSAVRFNYGPEISRRVLLARPGARDLYLEAFIRQTYSTCCW